MNECEWWSFVVFGLNGLSRWCCVCVEMVHGSPAHHCAVSFAVSMVVSFCLFCFLCIFFTPVVSGHCFGVFVVQPSLGGVRCDRRIVCCRFSYTSTTRRHRRDNERLQRWWCWWWYCFVVVSFFPLSLLCVRPGISSEKRIFNIFVSEFSLTFPVFACGWLNEIQNKRNG